MNLRVRPEEAHIVVGKRPCLEGSAPLRTEDERFESTTATHEVIVIRRTNAMDRRIALGPPGSSDSA
jgi:hypothetical protein